MESCTAGLPGDRGTPGNSKCQLLHFIVVFEVSKVLPLIVMIGRRSMLSGSESTNAYLLVGWKGSPGTDVTKMF